MDFGIAAAAHDSSLTATGSLLGTAAYMSPEHASGRPATPASDVYALSVVLYEALTGAPPFHLETPVATAAAHVHTAPGSRPDARARRARAAGGRRRTRARQGPGRRVPASAAAFADLLRAGGLDATGARDGATPGPIEPTPCPRRAEAATDVPRPRRQAAASAHPRPRVGARCRGHGPGRLGAALRRAGR